MKWDIINITKIESVSGHKKKMMKDYLKGNTKRCPQCFRTGSQIYIKVGIRLETISGIRACRYCHALFEDPSKE